MCFLLHSLLRSIAISHCCIVVYVWHFVVYFTTVISIFSSNFLRVNNPLMVHHYTGITHWTRSIRRIFFRIFWVSWRELIRNMLWNTPMRLFRLTCQLGIEISSKLRVKHHNLRDCIFIPWQLILQEFAIFGINTCLKFISLNTSIKAKL